MSTDQRWRTTDPDHVILAVARTLTSAIRLMDAIALLDERVRVIYTADPASVSPGATAYLERLGVRLTPWETAAREEYHLVLTASENVDFTRFRDVPVVVIPHGVGFHKQVPDSATSGTRLSGLVPEDRRGHSRVIHVVSHPDHLTGVETFLAGDPCHDNLLTSADLRDRYREAFGVTGRLVLVTSTWGRQSLFGTDLRLPQRLLAELPYDEFRVACALHPAIWAEDGEHEVRRKLRDALDAGLILLRPENGWQQAVVAADVVIGDHGSVTLYAAAHGVPVLLGAFGTAEVEPGTALAAFGAAAPHLDRGHDLLPQLAKAETVEVTPSLFATTGTWATRLTELLHDLLGLPSTEPPRKALPLPDFERRPVHSHVVYTEDGELRRFPAAAGPDRAGTRHLAVTEDELDLRLRHNASVYVRTRPAAEPAAWLADAMRKYQPKVAGIVTDTGCLLLINGRTITADDRDVLRAASVLYAQQLS